MQNKQLFRQIDALQDEMTQALSRLIRTSAIGPENGGQGENHKAEVLLEILADVGFDKIEHCDAEDARVPSGKRPNVIAACNGEAGAQKLWIVTHLDVVPSGEESLWKVTKPFEPKVKDGCVFGRGSEDNGQSVVASVFAVKALRMLGLKLKREVALAFVSDEEMGSTKGIQHLLDAGLFGKEDLVLVPDTGSSDGGFIEIAEKSILWFKLTTFGKQTHGSLPNKGLNAHRVGMQVALAVDGFLHNKYNARNDCFDVPYSTFEPTRKDHNVDALNMVPGEDAVYFDFRVLPSYSLEAVIADIRSIVEDHETKTGAKIQLEILNRQDAPSMVDGDAEIVALLKSALKQARGVDARVGGIGGGTCAAFFRKAGIPAVGWSTIDEVAHQPDEYSRIRNIVEDAKVFALLMLT